MLIEEKLTGKIIQAAIEVHKALGPGLLESVYDKCLSKEFDIIKLIYNNQVELPIVYKGIKVDAGYRID
ncbi:MAG TPA: GxxExxY protein, partial [Candidatus Marinimicrobia bacterium]|nr:GxxExxY protein [Candidatus Neomarinimicrobiota bacterium]